MYMGIILNKFHNFYRIIYLLCQLSYLLDCSSDVFIAYEISFLILIAKVFLMTIASIKCLYSNTLRYAKLF